MTKKLSDLNSSIEFTPRPQSPARAGQTINAATDDITPWTNNGWLECDGSAVSRTTYADLFANISTKYGIGDGSTTFNLPNGPRRTVEVDLDLGGDATVTNSARGYAYQDYLGVWKLNFNLFVETASSNARNISVAGTTYTVQQAITVALNSTTNFGDSFANASSLQVQASGPRSSWRVSGDIELDSKPTDAFVGADSRFTTFDEALESIPLIKAYNDASNISMSLADATATRTGAVRLNSDFAAGDGVYGLVQANRSQTKTLPSNITTANTDFLVFNNLVIGRRYEYKGVIGLAGSISHIEIFENTTAIKRIIDNTTTGNTAGFYYEFTATETIIKLRTNSSWNGTVNSSSGGLNSSWATLTELNNDIITTDFT